MNLHVPDADGRGPCRRTPRRFRDLVAEDGWRQHRPVRRRQPGRRARPGDVGASRHCRRPRGRHHPDRLFPQRIPERRAISSGTALPPLAVLGAARLRRLRHAAAALAYLGINPSKPAVEFEIRLPKAALSAMADTQVELHTDRNQTLAQMSGRARIRAIGRSVLRGSVPLDSRTTDRVVILDLPGRRSASSSCGWRPTPATPTSSGRGIWPIASLPRRPGRFRTPRRMTPSRSAIGAVRSVRCNAYNASSSPRMGVSYAEPVE